MDVKENRFPIEMASCMRIIHVVDSLEVGGAEMLVALLCRFHRKEGQKPAVHCLFDRGPLADQLDREGFDVYYHGPAPPWTMARILYRQFRRMRPDVVHCHNATATILSTLAARLAGVKAIISTRHGLVRPPYPLRRELTYWMAASCCDRVVAVCDAARRNLEVGCGADPHKIVTIRNTAVPASMGASAARPISKKGFTLINVARLAWYKDHASLLRALALVCRQIPDINLWIIGDGTEAIPLQALVAQLQLQNHVQFLGFRGDVGRWLAAADLFVLSSLTEGLPVSLLEAMAAGLPAIVTDVGGMPEIARLSKAATVVPRGSPEALAQAIIKYATHRESLEALGVWARRCYEKHFSAERMAGNYLDLYRTCIHAKGNNDYRF